MKVEGTGVDFNQPESASRIGTELATTTAQLVHRLTPDGPFLITTTTEADQAVIDRQTLGATIKRVEEFFEPFVSMAYRLHQALCDRRRDILAPLKALDQQKSRALTDYKFREDLARRERERVAAEDRRREDQARATAEAAALERQGEHAMAAAVIDEAIAAPEAIVVLPDTTKAVEGLSYRRTWKWRFVNDDRAGATAALLPREFLTADITKLNAHVRAHKGTTKIPGIQVFFEDVPIR